MSEALKFGFKRPKGSHRLSVTGPTAVIAEAMSSDALHDAREGLGSHSVLTYTSRLERAHVDFNARAIGALRDEQKKQHALNLANGFVSELVDLVKAKKVQPDPRIDLTIYTPTWDGSEFEFLADVARPEKVGPEVLAKVGASAMRMAYDLKAFPGATSVEGCQRYMTGDIDLNRHGVALRIRPFYSVHTNGDEWDPTASRFKLRSNNVLDGEQPLIFLAAAVALAHVDELA